MIDPRRVSIESVLESSMLYEVPEYQRGFEWGEEEAENLFDDLQSSAAAGSESLFLGTLIFQSKGNGNQLYQIVDGQQRLTTILLLLLACREKARKEGQGKVVHEIQKKLTPTDSATGDSLGCRLK